MRAPFCVFALGAVAAFTLATWLEPWFQQWAGNRARSANLLQVALGDGRKLFARHFYAKADAYFHRGFYPTIFDARPAEDAMHLATHTTDAHAHAEEDHHWLGQPKDWLERFSRHFIPSRHLHLGEEADDPGHAEHACGVGFQPARGAALRAAPQKGHEDHAPHAQAAAGEERELLPWLRVAASLDPEEPQTYLVTAFWLRTRLGRVDEAEQFLREGLRHVPGHPELLFELGRIQRQHRSNLERARILWELALRQWRRGTGQGQEASDRLVGAQILSHLAKLEEDAGDYASAAGHLEALLSVSPNREAVQRWLEEVRAKAGKRD